MPKDYGGDGESIDTIIFGDTIPRGSVVKVKVLGIMNLVEGNEFDAKLMAVRVGTPEYEVSDITELTAKFGGVVDEVVDWFRNYQYNEKTWEQYQIEAANFLTKLGLKAQSGERDRILIINYIGRSKKAKGRIINI